MLGQPWRSSVCGKGNDRSMRRQDGPAAASWLRPSFARRDLLIGGAAFAASLSFASRARSQERNALWLTGAPTQGGLVMGRAGPGSQVWVNDLPVRVNDGLFCFGFGRDAGAPVTVRVEYRDGTTETKTVSPAQREFPVQRIDGLPEQYVSPPPEVQERIARDARAVAEARRRDTGRTWFADQFIWPAEGTITSVYGSQRILNGEPRAPHYGVDIAAPTGTPVRAPANAVVSLASDLYLSGNTMILDHGHGVSTTYLHLSRMDYAAGRRVDRGDQIGLIGATGRATGPHLCWRLNWFQTRLDVALVAPPRDRA